MDECSRPIRRSVECVNDLIEMSITISKATHTLKVLLHCADAGMMIAAEGTPSFDRPVP